MKNRIKDILGSKKIICMVTICTVFLCALIVTIFLTNQKQDKNGKKTEIAEETVEKVTTSSTKETTDKDTTSSVKKKEAGLWTDYNAFIETPVPDEYEDNENLTFADFAGKELWHYSGAGAWSMIITINDDGTFDGYYHDSDVGSRWECTFSGRFSDLTRTGSYEYTMKCVSLKVEREPGTEEMVDDIWVSYTEPFGFEEGKEFKVYLPGKAANELPEGFISWSNGNAESGYLECYGLYNGEDEGFVEVNLPEYEDSYDYGE